MFRLYLNHKCFKHNSNTWIQNYGKFFFYTHEHWTSFSWNELPLDRIGCIYNFTNRVMQVYHLQRPKSKKYCHCNFCTKKRKENKIKLGDTWIRILVRGKIVTKWSPLYKIINNSVFSFHAHAQNSIHFTSQRKPKTHRFGSSKKSNMGGGVAFYTARFLLIFLAVSSSVVNCCPPSERAALLAFKAALHEPYLGIFNSWTGNDCCHNWYGVSCDQETHRVADINLRGESEDPIFQRAHRTGYMTGYISPAVCKLTRLSSFTLADWKGISGEIPRCISSIPYLRILDLIGNKLSGDIPRDIGRLHRLAVLNIADNNISGTIPPSIANLSSLMHLDLRNNRISGPIPGSIGRLRMMSRALLSRNQISGTIPGSISLIYRLADLDLSMNQISGMIPASLGKMAVLATLNLDFNKLSGPIPASLMNSGISNLNLSRNMLEGKIPDIFGPRSYFTAIDLAYNKLSGPIPRTMSAASYIGHLDFSHNYLCGRIPDGSPFDHLEASSFAYNKCLCGKPLRAC